MPEQTNQEMYELMQKVYEQNRKIQRRLTLMIVSGYLKIALFVIPLIVGFFFLSPLLTQAFAQYEALLSGEQAGQQQEDADISKILSTMSPEDMQKAIRSLSQ